MLAKRPSDITEADLEALIAGGAMEGLTLQFKVNAIGSGDRDKREFLAESPPSRTLSAAT